MKSANKLFAASVLAAATTVSATANATVFAVDYHDAGVWSAYNSADETYSMRFRSDQGNDGFWLVVSDGDNPKGGSDLAILYGDIENNRITAYSYNGENNASSYTDGTLLGTYENAFTSGGRHGQYGYEQTNFSLDVSAINAALGDGVRIGEEAGIWFHQSAGSEFTYGADGSIVNYAFDTQSFLDRGNDSTGLRDNSRCTPGSAIYWCQDATQIAGGGVGGGLGAGGATGAGGGSVPAPGGLALILVGLAGLGRRFCKKA